LSAIGTFLIPLLLLKEFAHKIGFHQLLQNSFKTNDKSNRYHTDDKNLLQKLYQLTAGYFQDDDSDELTTDPVLTTILEKEKLASQPTMSRFMNRCDDICLMQFESIHEELRRRIYSINKPQSILLDIDSTLFATFGKQEGNDYNQHYSNYGYHPLLVFDGLTGDLLKAELRSGNTYTSKGAPNFLYPLLLELQDEYPETNLFLRGDSGFADVLMYEKLETNKTSYAIRLKENGRLRKLASEIEHELYEKTIQNVQKVYYEEFEEIVREYNEKQTRADRRIDNYFEHVAKLDQDMAVEIIFQCGDKNFWDEHTDNKDRMFYVFSYLLSQLQEQLPDFKVANAVIHFDEASPHMHVIGVPIGYGAKRGLPKKVSKRNVFTPETLSVYRNFKKWFCRKERIICSGMQKTEV
jgi:hypothetical protein